MINVIPRPLKAEENYGEFVINNNTLVYSDEMLTEIKDTFVAMLTKSCTFKLKTIQNPIRASISFLYDRSIAKEGYKITADSANLYVYAGDYSGGLYAIETLRQLLNLDALEKVRVISMHAISIEDRPRYSYRGLMLDEARHFFGAEFVKCLLEMMALAKLNVLSWHLADNEGWRIETKTYPSLTEIGSVRMGTQYLCKAKEHVNDNLEYTGFYTKQQITEIINYAKDLNITVIPHIPMPTHMAAAIAAYPELSCTGDSENVPVNYGKNGAICLAKPQNYTFIYALLDEICTMFESPYINIGQINDLGLCDQCKGLQLEFINKISLYLKCKGKTLVMTSNCKNSQDIDKDVIFLHAKARDKSVDNASINGRRLIFAEQKSFGFDLPYACVNLSKTYNFEPMVKLDNVLGVEGQLWTEWIRTPERAQFQMFPRLQALAENAWSDKSVKDYQDFRKRLKRFAPILDKHKLVLAPQNMYECSFIKGMRYYKIYRNKNAHYEYKKAMHKSRHEND